MSTVFKFVNVTPIILQLKFQGSCFALKNVFNAFSSKAAPQTAILQVFLNKGNAYVYYQTNLINRKNQNKVSKKAVSVKKHELARKIPHRILTSHTVFRRQKRIYLNGSDASNPCSHAQNQPDRTPRLGPDPDNLT